MSSDQDIPLHQILLRYFGIFIGFIVIYQGDIWIGPQPPVLWGIVSSLITVVCIGGALINTISLMWWGVIMMSRLPLDKVEWFFLFVAVCFLSTAVVFHSFGMG